MIGAAGGWGQRLVRVGAVGAGLATLHTLVNARRLRVPPLDPAPVEGRVSVLLPARNEARRIAPCLRSLRAQRGVGDLEIVVVDDRSTDDTRAVVRRELASDPRARLLLGREPPPGWLGKPHAAAQLAAAATGRVLVFVDADVVLAPEAIIRTVALLEDAPLDLVSPYPRQRTGSVAERLVQPLLQWSWLTFLPLAIAERSPHPSLGAANGQLLAVRRDVYDRAGGHAGGAVRGAVLDDLALLRAVKRAGGRGGVTDGTTLATCRMYAGWPALAEGYTKSLWAAFGGAAGSAAVLAGLGLMYVLPPVAALVAGSRAGALGYAAGVAGRAVAARRTGGRVWPDALAHPVSMVLLGWLTARSHGQRRWGRLRWKDRPVR